TMDTANNFYVYKSVETIANLPIDEYTVTVTTQFTTNKRFTLDAIQVYGDVNNLGSLYDDAQKAPNGSLLITYGPDNKSWTAASGGLAFAQLNKTHHETRTYGAVATFEIGNPDENAIGLNLYYGVASSSNNIEICFRDQN